jgi:hypothetical protein
MDSDSGYPCETSVGSPLEIQLAYASRGSSGIQVILGTIQNFEQKQVITQSAQPLISISLSDEAARRLHDLIEQLTTTGD